jgi:hypothetical protein
MFHVIVKVMKAQHVVFVIYIWKNLLLLFILYFFFKFVLFRFRMSFKLCIDWHALHFFVSEYIYIWCLSITLFYIYF